MTDQDAAPTDSPRTGTDVPVNEVRTIVFRVTPWRALDVWRDIELREDQTLHALHEGIQDAFELDRDHFYAFYLNDHAFDRMHNYEGPESAVTERRALDTRLGHLPLRENKRFLYLFDFGDELRHDVRVVGHSASESGVSYPRLVGAKGEVAKPDVTWQTDDDAPDESEDVGHDTPYGSHDQGRIDEDCQFSVPPEVREALEELIPDLRVCVTRSEQRWLDGEEEPKPNEAADVRRTLVAEYELAKVLLERAACDFKVIHLVLEDPLEQNVWGWLAELPEDLSRAELHEPAIELTKTLLAVAPESSLRAQLPLFLLQAGYGEQAIEAVERALAEDPDNPRLLHAAAQTHQTLGDTERAIAHYTEALTWVGSERDLRNDIVQGLVHLLDSTGQSAAGIRLLQHEQEVEQSWLAPWERRSVPIRREQPKTGRNDPCPCGSNKKYKKCCGR